MTDHFRRNTHLQSIVNAANLSMVEKLVYRCDGFNFRLSTHVRQTGDEKPMDNARLRFSLSVPFVFLDFPSIAGKSRTIGKKVIFSDDVGHCTYAVLQIEYQPLRLSQQSLLLVFFTKSTMHYLFKCR